MIPINAHTGPRKPDTPGYNSVTIAGRRGPLTKKWINLQLPLYHLLYTGKEELDANIEFAYFNLPKAISATGISVWSDFNPAMMGSAVTCIKGVIESIDEGIFWPPAENMKYEDDFGRIFTHEAEKNFEAVKRGAK